MLGCSRESKQAAPAAGAAGGGEGQLTAFELENGIGPVTEAITLGPLDHELAEAGKALFESKCSACHKMTEKYVGPALGEVTLRRTPAYIMNMVLDPEGMYTRHPVARQLLAEHMTQMPNLGLTRDQARQIVEYLRTQAPAKAAT
ncbi:MAG TPA: cytochrome c [Gemmatimonadales bacterium]|nr:cytochrome c [Gemmatimonadales bacterium]